MKAIVTGSSGFIGKRLTELLLESNHEVLGIDPLKPTISHSNYHHHIGYFDSLNNKDIKSFFNKETILYHVGAKKHRDSIENYNEMIFANVEDLKYLTNLLIKHPVKRVVFTSSLYVYGISNEAPFSEKSFTAPHSLYGITKLLGEKLFENLSKSSDIKHTILRLFFIYGPGQNTENSNYDSLIHKTIKKLRNKENPIIYGSGNQTMDFVFVDDLCKFMIEHTKDGFTENLISNFSSGKHYSVKQVIEKIKQILDSNVKNIHTDADWTEGLNRYGTIDNLRKYLKINELTSLDDGLKKCIDG